MNTPYTPDLEETRKYVRLTAHEGDVRELRIFGVEEGRFSNDYTGYFNNSKALLQAVEELAPKARHVYITLNPVNPDLLARCANRVERIRKGASTSDKDIPRRRFLPIDCDPVRPSEISSTDAQHEAAISLARKIRDHLRAGGWPEPALIDSGNGCWLLYAIDLPGDDSGLVQRVTDALALRFNTETVIVDPTTANASQLGRVPGAFNRKGDDMPERPHRMSRVLEGDSLVPVAPELLTDLAATLPKPEPQERGGAYDFEDVAPKLAEWGLEVEHSGPSGDGTLYRLRACPWGGNSDGNPWVWQAKSGALAAGCFEAKCHGKGWRDLRETYAPEDRAPRSHRTRVRDTDFRATPDWPPLDSAQEPKPIPWHTGAEIAAATPERLVYLAEPYFVAGSLIELAGPIKRSGKTTLALNLARAVLTSGQFIGGRVGQAAPVIYMTEEGPTSFQAALARQGIDSPNLHVVYKNEVRGIPWATVMQAVRQKARETGAKLVVVDTISGWCDFGVDAENDAASALQAATPMQEATAEGVTVLFTRHDRKGSGVIGESGRGSSALGGAVDVLLHLQPANVEGHPNRRSLAAAGRFDGLPDMQVLEWDGGNYLLLGDAIDVERAQAKNLLMEYLPASKESGMTEEDMEKHQHLKAIARSTRRRVLKEWEDSGSIHREKGFGKNGRAFGYWMDESPPPTDQLTNKGYDPGHMKKSRSNEPSVERTEVTSPHPPGHLVRNTEVTSPQSLNGQDEKTAEDEGGAADGLTSASNGRVDDVVAAELERLERESLVTAPRAKEGRP